MLTQTCGGEVDGLAIQPVTQVLMPPLQSVAAQRQL